jgi:glutaredoxin
MGLRNVFLGFSIGLAMLACDRPPEGNEAPLAEAVEAVAPSGFELPREGHDALFVWVKENGDFQTSNRFEDVAASARDVVRVIHPEHPSSPALVWTTDLRAADGKLLVRPLPRAEWEKRGMAERQARVEAARPKETPPPSADAIAGVNAIVYGASWCHACHLAEEYLQKRKVAVVKKDIEEDPSAHAEMAAKLRRAGQSGSSIPVIDIGGTILVGFSEGAVNAALTRAAKPVAL